MKKNYRQEKILSIIEEFDIGTQEELLDKLNESGFNVTQATVSRDIKALNLIKIQDSTGRYKYASVKKDGDSSEKYDAILSHSVISIDFAGNITVVKCYPGMANAACASIDALHFEKSIGSIAGDDTIFILNKTPEAAEELAQTIKKSIKR
ncbi:MAG: arginine repressor [Acutalibacteraceae bacterium]